MYYAFAGALHIALSAKAAGLTEQHLRKPVFGGAITNLLIQPT